MHPSLSQLGVILVCLQSTFARATSNSISPPGTRHLYSPRSNRKAPLLTRANSSCANTASSRNCWSDGYDITTDSETSWPNTGKTISYTLEITNTTLAPDGGTARIVFVINGQFPGPIIQADWGDTLSITVKNSLQYNGTSMHWHGIQQKDTNNMDGTNGITECPLAPGDSRTYTFLATQYGTSWYHSHYGVQYSDGVQGPIVINGPASANYDVDLGPLPITDWHYITATQIDWQVGYGVVPTPPQPADNALINGTMVSPSGRGGTYARTTLQPGRTHRLRLINTSADNHFKVHLDSHTMTIIQADFVAIQPQTVDWLFIGIGQRYDVLITANESVSNYWFRAEPQSECGNNTNAGNIKSIFSYSGAPSDTDPTSTSTTYTSGCDDQTGLVPYVSKDVPSDQFASASSTLDVLLSTGYYATWSNGSSVIQWSFGDELMSIDYSDPTLSTVFSASSSNTTYNFTAADNVIQLPTANAWTFWIIQAIQGVYGTTPHPIHLHGHNFYVLGAGTGTFSDAGSLNYENPTRRDVVMMPASGWVVVAFVTDNPGAWLMHCHIAWHVSEGFALQFLERAPEIPSTFSLEDDYYTQCANWDAYQSSAAGQVYKRFGSGL